MRASGTQCPGPTRREGRAVLAGVALQDDKYTNLRCGKVDFVLLEFAAVSTDVWGMLGLGMGQRNQIRARALMRGR